MITSGIELFSRNHTRSLSEQLRQPPASKQHQRTHSTGEIITPDQHIKIVSKFHAEHRDIITWKENCRNVVFPSLVTKSIGRALMLGGIIPNPTSVSFSTFVLSNLCYAAPAIAVAAGLFRFFYVLHQERKKGTDWRNALWTAFKAFTSASFKFFTVYMAWTLGMALAANLCILTGPFLPLGILLVAAATAGGFMLASFATDLLSGNDNKWHKLKKSFLPAFFEGSIWTLLDSLNLSSLLHCAGAQSLDTLIVCTVVSSAFLIGSFAYSFVRKLSDYFKKPCVIVAAPRINRDIQTLFQGPNKQPINFNPQQLAHLKARVPHGKAKDLLEKYIKYTILYNAILRLEADTHTIQSDNTLYQLNENLRAVLATHRGWTFLPVFFHCMETWSLSILKEAETLRNDLVNQTNQQRLELTPQQLQAKRTRLHMLKKQAEKKSNKASEGLEEWGIFPKPPKGSHWTERRVGTPNASLLMETAALNRDQAAPAMG